MPQNRLPFLAPVTAEGFQAKPVRVPSTPPLEGLVDVASFSSKLIPSAIGPYQSMEELYKQAYAQPQRVRTQRLSTNVDDPSLGYETEEIIQPGWQKQYATDILARFLETQNTTENADRSRLEEIRKAQQGANLAGFDRPVDKALYERRIAEEKMRQPIEIQNSQNTQESLNTMMSGQNAMNVARLQDEGYTQRAKSAEDFQKWLMQNNPVNTPVSSYTAPGRYGGGGTKFDTNPTAAAQVPAATKRLVADAWYNYKQNPNVMTESSYLMTAGQALESALASGAIDSKTVDAVREIMRDKNRRDLPFETLVQDFESYDAENPEISRPLDPNDPVDALDLAQLQRALLLIKGL